MREHFGQVLDNIRHDVVRMGAKVNDLVKAAIDAVLNGDLELAHRVIADDDEIDKFEHEMHRRTVLTVLQESPVASDFRFLVSALGVVGEIEKAADDAVKLARRARKLSGYFPAEMRVALVQLGEQSRQMFNSSIRLFADYSDELAGEIIAADESVDTAYTRARNTVIDMIRANPENTDHLVRTIDSFHALEHIADHAVEIAKRLQMLHAAKPRA